MASTSWSQRELLFNEIKKRLTPIREITDVRIWNDHLIDNNNQEWKAPVVFIDFSPDRNMEEYTNNLYRVEQEMIIKVVIENYTLNKLDIYKLTDAVKAYLTGWVAPDLPMEKLVLSRENEDTPFDNLRCINILYNLVTFEQSNPYGIVYVGGTSSCIELELTSGMDSNNDGVTWRNGGTFSGLSYLYSNGCFITGSTGMTGMTGCSFSEIDINDPDFCFTHPFPLMDNCIPMPDDVNSGWDCVSSGFGGGQGPRGYQGPKGSQGSKGSTGPQGVQGSAGVDGVIGVDGATGPQGVQGSNGPQGSVGPQGVQGSNGPQGSVGPQGVQGSNGPQGSVGPQGVQGSNGPQGSVGPQGVQGPESSGSFLPLVGGTLSGQLTLDDQILQANNIVSDNLLMQFNGLYLTTPSTTFTFPVNDGMNGDVLTTDGSGGLTFTQSSGINYNVVNLVVGPEGFSTIQAAVDYHYTNYHPSSIRGVVEIRGGIYTENVSVLSNFISFKGYNNSTIIGSINYNPVLNDALNISIEDLEIQSSGGSYSINLITSNPIPLSTIVISKCRTNGFDCSGFGSVPVKTYFYDSIFTRTNKTKPCNISNYTNFKAHGCEFFAIYDFSTPFNILDADLKVEMDSCKWVGGCLNINGGTNFTRLYNTTIVSFNVECVDITVNTECEFFNLNLERRGTSGNSIRKAGSGNILMSSCFYRHQNLGVDPINLTNGTIQPFNKVDSKIGGYEFKREDNNVIKFPLSASASNNNILKYNSSIGELEWVTTSSLIGPQGFQGVQGSTGSQGLQGFQGSQGPQASISGLTKSDVGLDQVDNTSDVNKPISTATQNALNGKVNVPLYFITNTTNNSLTNIVPVSIALGTNKSIRYHLKGRSTTTNNRFAAECWFEADNTGGVVTLIGTLSIDRKSTFTNAVQTSVTVSGSNVNININGPNGQTVVWELYVKEIL